MYNTQSSSLSWQCPRSIHPSPPSSLHSSMIYLFSTTWTHSWGSSIPLSYHLGTQNTGTLARCNKPEDFILAHFSMCGARHVGATSEKILAYKWISHPSKFLIDKLDHYRFVMVHSKWLWLDRLMLFKVNTLVKSINMQCPSWMDWWMDGEKNGREFSTANDVFIHASWMRLVHLNKSPSHLPAQLMNRSQRTRNKQTRTRH